MTVRAPVPSGFGPTVISTILPAVFSKQAVEVRPAAAGSRPSHRQQVLAGLHVHAGLGQRRAQLRVPVQAAVDLLEAVAAVLDLVVGARAARRGRSCGCVEAVAAADAVMADGQLAAHPLDHPVQVVAAARSGRNAAYFFRIACQSAPCMFGA